MNNTLLSKTWLFDIDGTLIKHAGISQDGYDQFLPGVEDALKSIPSTDTIIFLTARSELLRHETEEFFIKNNIRFDKILFGLPTGERILVNDLKPSGYVTAYSENLERNQGFTKSLISKYLTNS